MYIKRYLLALGLILLLSCDLTTEEKLHNATQDYLELSNPDGLKSFSINSISTLTEREVYLLEYQRKYDKLIESLGNHVLVLSSKMNETGKFDGDIYKKSTSELRQIHDSISDLSRQFTRRFIDLDDLKPKYYKVDGKYNKKPTTLNKESSSEFSFFFSEDFSKIDIHDFILDLEKSKL